MTLSSLFSLLSSLLQSLFWFPGFVPGTYWMQVKGFDGVVFDFFPEEVTGEVKSGGDVGQESATGKACPVEYLSKLH